MSRFRLRASVIGVFAAFGSTLGACGSATPKTAPTGTGGAGGSDAGAGASGADGSRDSAPSPGTVTLRLVLPTTQSFCDEGCGPPAHIEILTSAGQLVPTIMPSCFTSCSAGCKPVSCPVGGACLPQGLAFTGAQLSWDGSSYPMSTCGAGTACYAPQFVAPGRYIARMCATPGTLTTPDGGVATCTATGATECIDVPFDFPGQSSVEGTLGTSNSDGGSSFEAGAPLGSCRPGTADSCSAGSTCVAGCPMGSNPMVTTPGGLCSAPGRETCGCGVVLSPCTTPGLACLLPSCCDFEGLCVTPSERAVICSGPDAIRFDCAGSPSH
jgi:hypothetical protein